MDIDLGSFYEEVYDLLEVRSKGDPQSEPHKSKYEARSILEIMKSKISRALDQQVNTEALVETECSELTAQLAAVYSMLGIIGLETEEFSTGQENLEKAIELLSCKEISPNSVTVLMICLDNLALIWAQRDEQEKAEKNLLQAIELYTKYKNLDEAKPPKSPPELFTQRTLSGIAVGWKGLEKSCLLTQYYLAQVVGRLGRPDEAAKLLLATLHLQLPIEDYQPLTWGANAADLARYFVNKHRYRLARRILAAASTMIQKSLESESQDVSQEERETEKVAETKAQVALNWGSYSVSLLQRSFDVLSGENEDNDTAISEEEFLDQMEFCSLEISAFEEGIDYELAKDYEGAKKLFMSGLRWLNEARNFYSLEDHATTHTEVSQTLSTLYKLLASFDSDPDRRSKMHKRRIDLLSPVLQELNTQFYLQVCRQLDYELGETYSNMVDCKYETLSSRTPNAHQATKINSLVKSSIKHFQSYLDSFLPPSGEKVEVYPEDSERPVLVAYFHIGRLWSKMVAGPAEEKLACITNSLDSYKILVNYCEKNAKGASLMAEELPVCREMVQLLPYKLDMIRAQT